MKYVVFTTKHHDGFCLFDTKYTDFKVTNTPAKRDVLAELEFVGNESGALDNRAKLAVDVLACKRGLRERDEKIGDLRIALVALPGGRDDNDAPRGIREDDVNYLV